MEYISEDYCSEELSGMLIEKGYRGATTIYLSKDGLKVEQITIQSAMKWLREVHNIHIEIGYNMGYFPVCISIQTNETIPYIAMQGKPFTYEEACQVAIKYCLENLI